MPTVTEDATYHLVRRDFTIDWAPEFLKKYEIVKAETLYLFDPESRTFCCEVTPSFELWPVCYEFTFSEDATEEQREEVYEETYVALYEEGITYMHCHTIDVSKTEVFGQCSSIEEAAQVAATEY